MNNKNITHRRRTNNRSPFLKIIIFTLISVLVVVISFTALFIILYKPSVGIGGPSLNPSAQDDPMAVTNEEGDVPPVTSSGNTNAQRKQDFYTFLIMGRDNVGLNTDIIMLLSFDIKNGSINIMQIPRDTYMKVGSSPIKINAAYGIMHNRAYSSKQKDTDDAAMRDTIALLEQNLSIKIDNYALCNLTGFCNIIDIIGGVKMDVPYDMYYSDPYQDLYIDIKKGLQTLDGATAEQFIRFRSGYVEADIGRIDAQKLFMSALINQIKTSINIVKLTGIAKEAVNNIKTSMSLVDILYFAKEFYLINNANMNFITFPGTPVRAEITSGASYYIMHRADMLALLNKYYNVYESEITDTQFDSKLSFTNTRLPHINDLYNTELSADLNDFVHSADQINKEGLDISLIN